MQKTNLKGVRLTMMGVLALAVVRVCAVPPLKEKDAFMRGFPQYLAFRGEMERAAHKDYDTWRRRFEGTAGVIRKFVPEELPALHPESHLWADRYARENPGRLMLLHLNGESRQVMDFPDVHARYFPGHWMYTPGTLLTADVGPQDTVLKVQDPRMFKAKAYLDRNAREKGADDVWFPQHLLLVPLDDRGQRCWYEAEYAIVEKVDAQTRALTVRRGAMFSKAIAHKAGRTYVAPVAAEVWGGKPMWFYNLSSVCPQDRNGKNAADVFVDEIAEWFAPNGRLGAFDGIAFDVNYWEAREPFWDTDNDGRGDNGIVAGRNVWREGDWHFQTALRRALGDGHLLSADGQHVGNQRAVGVFDGVESEGLVQHNDGFRGFSRMVNTHLYWAENTNRAYDFRYVVLKLKHPDDARRGPQLRRFAVGAACCVGALVTAAEEEFMPAAFAAPGSLGFPKGPLLRPARQAPDVLGGVAAPVQPDFVARLHTEDAIVRLEDGWLHVIPRPESTNECIKITLKDVAFPAGDITFFLDMVAVDPLEGFARESRVPRAVSIHLSRYPDYGEGRYNSYYTHLNGYIGPRGGSPQAFYFRRPKVGPETLDVTIEVEGRGRVRMRSFTAHNAPDVLVREFDRGVVVVNPAMEPVDVPLGELLSNRPEMPVSVTVPALDAHFLATR